MNATTELIAWTDELAIVTGLGGETHDNWVQFALDPGEMQIIQRNPERPVAVVMCIPKTGEPSKRYGAVVRMNKETPAKFWERFKGRVEHYRNEMKASQ